MRSVVCVILVAAGCSQSAVDYGKALLSDPGVSDAASNPFSCTTCHQSTATASGLHPGYTLYDSVNRPSWWGGFEGTLLDALNQCVVNFMRGRELTPSDDKGRALYVYLQTIAPDANPSALSLTVVQNIVDVPSGDPSHGKDVWDQACRVCHGDPHTGAGRISSLASIVPDDSIAAHGTDPKTGARPVVIEKVRHGRFFNVGGNMPLFSIEALSDGDLGALLGYLEMFNLPKSQ
jgi:thiosulfate dehydrogenase